MKNAYQKAKLRFMYNLEKKKENIIFKLCFCDRLGNHTWKVFNEKKIVKPYKYGGSSAVLTIHPSDN